MLLQEASVRLLEVVLGPSFVMSLDLRDMASCSQPPSSHLLLFLTWACHPRTSRLVAVHPQILRCLLQRPLLCHCYSSLCYPGQVVRGQRAVLVLFPCQEPAGLLPLAVRLVRLILFPPVVPIGR